MSEVRDGVIAIWGQRSSNGSPIVVVDLTPNTPPVAVAVPTFWHPGAKTVLISGGPHPPSPPGWRDVHVLATAGSRMGSLFALFEDSTTDQICLWRYDD